MMLLGAADFADKFSLSSSQVTSFALLYCFKKVILTVLMECILTKLLYINYM